MKGIGVCTLFLCILMVYIARAGDPIYDESLVPEYKLPELLRTESGRKIRNTKLWEKKRRPEILRFFEHEVYGKVPGKLSISDIKIWEDGTLAYDEKAIRKQLSLIFDDGKNRLSLGILMYLPVTDQKVPVFLAYNFKGNHSVCKDPNILLTESWVEDDPWLGIINNQVTEQSIGVREERWPIEEIINSGYGLVTLYYGDVDPDRNHFDDGVHPFFYSEKQYRPAVDEWGSISAWAWGLSRTMDYLETDSLVDASRVVLMGHSRLGKTALWAGALDRRFAIIISNDSGCGGAALSRRCFGETINSINHAFPHWFCYNFKKYSYNENALPVDQHMLLALIAPRPLYIASAEEDLWADPKGEFLSAKYASEVYQMMGLEGLPVDTMPPVNHPVMGTIGYHIRTGIHNITGYDWEQFIRFANLHLKP